MRYFIDLNRVYFEKINGLIEEKKYESVSQFVLVAIENQLYLEKQGVSKSAEANIADDSVERDSVVWTESKTELQKDEFFDKVKVLATAPVVSRMPRFSDLVAFPNDDEANCWLWGQINRIFPIKVGIRILFNKLDGEKWIDMEDFRNEAAEIASDLKGIIEKELSSNSKKVRRMSAGLPKYVKKGVGEVEVNNSKSRYKYQFLANVRNKDNKIDGALAQLKLINLNISDNNIMVGITEAGVKFAKIVNPILDNKDFSTTLSKEEIDFYIAHIKKNVKGEYLASIWLLRKIANGIDTRLALNKELEKDYNKKWGLDEKVVNTQRAGLLARMTELELTGKIKRGKKATYIITDLGKEILKENK